MKKIKGFAKTTIHTCVKPGCHVAHGKPEPVVGEVIGGGTDTSRKPLDPVKKDGDTKLSNKNIMVNVKHSPYILICLDTTGSMRQCVDECRKNLRELIQQLLTDDPRVRIGVYLAGDYCDGQFSLSKLDFTNSVDDIMRFFENTPNTNGGDEPELYEKCFKEAADMDWPEAGGSFILVGDAYPHDPDDCERQSGQRLDWKVEIQRLLDKNVKTFPCQCLYSQHRSVNNAFWLKVSSISSTPLLKMEFADSSATLGAIAYTSVLGSEGLRCYAASDSVCDRSETSLNFCASINTLTSYVAKVEKDEDAETES